MKLVPLTAVLLLAACASGDRPLQLVSGTGAVYPPQARVQGIEGHVVVRYDVDPEGRVSNARVVSAAPPDVFDEAAVQAVSRWRFQAPQRNGEAQAVTGLESRLEFTTKGGDAYQDY
jgi:protein TonB